MCMARGVCVCVCKGGMHGRGGMHGGGCAWQVGMRGGGHAWQVCIHGMVGVCMAGGVHGGGHAWWGACMPHTPPGHYEIRSVNARAVRILLECILFNV